jgi:hypothetical protein
MYSSQIQHAIADGISPFALCRIVATNIRASRKCGQPVQDSIASVLHSLSKGTPLPAPAAIPSLSTVVPPNTQADSAQPQAIGA